MSLSLSEALTDHTVLEELKTDPDSFRFREAPYAIVSMVTFANHIIMSPIAYESQIVKDGIPAKLPIYGPLANLLEILSVSLNFTYKLVVPSDYSWGTKTSNGSWSGMVGHVVRKEADIGLGPFVMIRSRYQETDMSMPFFFDNLGILVARGSAAIDPWGFLHPFPPMVWGMIVLSLVGVSSLHWLIQVVLDRKSGWIRQYGGVLFEYGQPLLDHALDRTTWKSWQRPLMGSWILVALLLNSTYGGNLKAMMALRYIPHPIQTLRDLIEDNSKKIIIEHRSAYLATVQRVPTGDVFEMNEVGKAGRYRDYKIKDFMKHSYRLLEGDHVQIFDTMTALYYRAKEFSKTGRCDFYLARETFLPLMYAIIGRKNSPLTPAIDLKIRRIFEAGIYNLWLDDFIKNGTACANPPTKVTLQDPINIGNIWGVAVIWSAGVALAAIAFAFEVMWDSIFPEDRDPE